MSWLTLLRKIVGTRVFKILPKSKEHKGEPKIKLYIDHSVKSQASLFRP